MNLWRSPLMLLLVAAAAGCDARAHAPQDGSAADRGSDSPAADHPPQGMDASDVPGGQPEGGAPETHPVCGNGVIESGEQCDPPSSCPTSCPNHGCTKFTLHGAAATCDALCVEAGSQTMCVHDDGCCPAGCDSTNDRDCNVKCNNGVKEGMETCDPLSSCPTTCPAVGCQLRKLVNSGTCTADCVNDKQQTQCAARRHC